MTEFVRTDEGWVNLDAVEKIIETEGKHGDRATFFAAGGRRLGSGARWDPYEHNGQIVPATADQHVVVIGEGDGPENPWVSRMPVIAWRIHSMYGYAIPIGAWETEGLRVLIPTDDGKFIYQENCFYDSLAEAIEAWKHEKRAVQAEKEGPA